MSTDGTLYNVLVHVAMGKFANCKDYNESTVINTAIWNIALHVCIHACSLEGTFMIACRIDYKVL